jgi:myo-inositol-1(or 4)-monophosphatase
VSNSGMIHCMSTQKEFSQDVPGSDQLQPIVTEAAELEILPRFQRVNIRQKADGSLVTDADIATQERIRKSLERMWPDIPFMGEEMPFSEQQEILAQGRYWCLDPLDGTTNYANGIPFFSISLALVEHGRAVIGLVYDPVSGECYRADKGAGAWLGDQRLGMAQEHKSLAQCVALMDFKRLPGTLINQLAAGPPYRSQRSLGSVALEWCWLAAGRAQLYLHGAQKPWDYAAGQLIFEEAGGVGCLLSSLASGEPESESGQFGAKAAVAASTPELLRQWRQWLKSAGNG